MAAAGLEATSALAETWGALAEVCHELSDTEWALPTECPGWDVKDQLSHLIGIERSMMGEPAPPWDGPFGEHVKNDFAAGNEPWIAVRRPFPGPTVRAEFVEVTRTRLAQLEALGEDEWAAVGWSPIGEVPRGLHGGAGLRQLGARAGRPPCPRPPGRVREPGLGHRARPGAGRHALRRRQAGRLRRGHRGPLRRRGPGRRRARLHHRRRRGGRARPVGDDVAPR